MAGIIKGYGYIPVQGDNSYNSQMKTVYGNKPVGVPEEIPEEEVAAEEATDEEVTTENATDDKATTEKA